MKLWEDILNILKTPFVGDLDLAHLFLLVGAVLIMIIIWAFVLQYMRAAGAAVTEAV